MGESKILKFLLVIIIALFGIVTITFGKDYFSSSSNVTPEPTVNNQIYFQEEEKSILQNEKTNLNLNANFTLATKPKYHSENPDIASVDENGLVTAKKAGTTNIVATYDDLTATIKINVTSNYYKIIYNYDAIKQKSVTEKCAIKNNKCTIKLKNVVNDNYVLQGWTLKKGSNEILDFNDTIEISKNTTLYLVASKKTNNLTITYSLNGATAAGKLIDTCNDDHCLITLPEISRKGNSEIIGWSTKSNSNVAEYRVKEQVTFTKNTTLYAITRTKYIATFYNNGAASITGNNLSNWTTGTGYIQTSCYALNKETNCIIYSPESINAGKNIAVGFNTDKSATTKTLGYNEKVILTEDINYYAITKESVKLTSMSDYSFPKETSVSSKKTLKILVIELNPLLYSITNTSLYKNNGGHPKVTEYFNQNAEKSLSEMIKDLEETSHGYLKISTKREWLNEFPTYRKKIKLNNGTDAYRFDEDTYISLSRKGNTDQGDWYSFITNSKITSIYSDNAYSYDYDYLINKYNLINRRNNGEFDQVWLLSIDPMLTHETIMIGNNPYWINAVGYKANCQNFQLVNVSISRRDANLHALGHGVEGIMQAAFHKSYSEYADYHGTSTFRYYTVSYNSYSKDTINISSLSEYNKLNLWEKFTLNTYSNKSNLSSIGNIHFAFNGTNDYDYKNTTKVYTNWREWLDYPNINGNFVLDNNNAWLKNAGNDKLDSTQEKNPDRLYTRFWLYLMPHMTGYTAEGYSNNWWDYFYSLDFVTSITGSNQTFKVGDQLTLKLKATYNSGKTKTLNLSKYEKNMIFQDKSLFSIDSSGNIYAAKKGSTTFKYYLDNVSKTTTITIN